MQIKTTGKGGNIIKQTIYSPNNQGYIGVFNSETNQTEINFTSGVNNSPRVSIDITIKEYEYNNDPNYSKYILRQIYRRNPGLSVCGYIDDNNNNDIVDTSDYDLQLLESGVYVNSLCSKCPDILERLNSGFFGGPYPKNRHLMSVEGSSVNTTLSIKNKGKTNSAPSKVKFYLSDFYNNTSEVIAHNKTIDLPSLNPGQEFITNPSFNIFDFNRSPGNYYLVVYIEEGDNDSNPSNNVINIPVEVYSTNKTTKTLSLNLGGYTSLNLNYSGIRNQSDNLKIYNLNYPRPVFNTQINNGESINLSRLVNSTYVIPFKI